MYSTLSIVCMQSSLDSDPATLFKEDLGLHRIPGVNELLGPEMWGIWFCVFEATSLFCKSEQLRPGPICETMWQEIEAYG